MAWKLSKAGYKVLFHKGGCDVSVLLSDSKGETRTVRFEVKHSEDNKDQDSDGHGYASWVISATQVEKKKFDLCVLLRDRLKKDAPDAVYVLTHGEIAETSKVDVNPPRKGLLCMVFCVL